MSTTTREEARSLSEPEEGRSVPSALERAAADSLALAAEAKAWHWTVAGPTFGELHALFDEIADHARGAADELAQRLVQLGARPPAFPGEWLRLVRVDVPGETGERTALEMLRAPRGFPACRRRGPDRRHPYCGAGG
ncbi:MAG TPA: ferritin-like domain-containing protein, partial [Actinomycetota bacterium]|nr:ferritin-like domain-containing protein [Actinomycetota bacterium]